MKSAVALFCLVAIFSCNTVNGDGAKKCYLCVDKCPNEVPIETCSSPESVCVSHKYQLDGQNITSKHCTFLTFHIKRYCKDVNDKDYDPETSPCYYCDTDLCNAN